MAEERYAVHAFLTLRARNGLEELASANRVNITALLEALGQHVADDLESGAELKLDYETWASQAAEVANRRRGRRRRA